jgi:NADPH-dependent 2,4-dienoyl-CoA reductase/sulfur reductase-like enzyme
VSEKRQLVIIGGNAAGIAAALRAKRAAPKLDITIIEQSEYVSAATCSIPSFLEGKIHQISSLQQLTPDEISNKHGINVLVLHRVLEIAPHRQQLTVENAITCQQFEFAYDRLILATGATPILPRIPGITSEGIFTLRSLEHASNIKRFLDLKKTKNIVILGTGTIAQVCLEGLKTSGSSVTLLGQNQNLMEDLDEVISGRIKQVMKNNYIKAIFVDKRLSINSSLEGTIKSLLVGDQNLSCDLLLVAIGINPKVELGKSAGLEVDKFGAFRVDRHLNTNKKNIYACGDCASTYHRLTHKPFYWPLATTASRQGRQAGESAATNRGIDAGTLAMRFWTCFDLQIGRVGISAFQANKLGWRNRRVHIQAGSKSKFFGGSEIDLVIYSEPETEKIIGAQMAGLDGVHARLNTMAVAIEAKMTIQDLERLDLAYNPKHSGLWDPIQVIGRAGDKSKAE